MSDRDLAKFVLARIAEREEEAQRGVDELDDGMAELEVTIWDLDTGIRYRPHYELARCAADRQIVEEHAAVVPPTGEGKVYCRICVAPGGFGSWSSFRGSVPGVHFPCRTLRLLALPDTSHPDYDESWKP